MSDAEKVQLARELAALAAPLVVEQIKNLIAPKERYLKGTQAIARELDISDDTLRRRGYVNSKQFKPGMLRVPICGTESYKHKGKPQERPVARAEDLKTYRENLPTRLR